MACFLKYRTDNRTRGSWTLAKERCKLDIRKYVFSQRTINEWNRLPGECVNATSLNRCSRIRSITILKDLGMFRCGL